MSYYDPLLQELEQLDQPNYLTQSGQAMSMRGAPINAGGGFWSNLAAQLVPGLLGAGMSYLGQQQNRGEEDALLAAAKLQDPQAIAASLEASGYKDKAAKVLFAAQAEQKAAKAAYAAKLQGYEDEYKYSIEPKHRLDMEKYNAQQSKLDSRAAARNAATLEAAGIAANAQLTGKARDLESLFVEEQRRDKSISAAREASQYAGAISSIMENARARGNGKLTGAEFFSLANNASRINTNEALSDRTIEILANTSGLQGKAKQLLGYAFDGGDVPIEIAENIANAASQVYQGKMAQSQYAEQDLARRFKQIGRGLPVDFTNATSVPPPIAVKIAKAITEGPQPVQMPKAAPTIVESKTVNGVTYNKYSDGRISKVGG